MTDEAGLGKARTKASDEEVDPGAVPDSIRSRLVSCLTHAEDKLYSAS